MVREYNPNVKIEVLIPDFKGDSAALEQVLEARPDVLNHNIETVPRLYRLPQLTPSGKKRSVRPQANYEGSLRLLEESKAYGNEGMLTKSGIMVGLGEDKDEVLQVMDDLRAAEVDFLTIGQYLQPTPRHHPVDRFVTPDEFEQYRRLALGKGFLMVASSPLTRSSYHAGEDFKRLRAAREARLRGEDPADTALDVPAQ